MPFATGYMTFYVFVYHSILTSISRRLISKYFTILVATSCYLNRWESVNSEGMESIKDADADVDIVVVVRWSSSKSQRSQHTRTTVANLQFD